MRRAYVYRIRWSMKITDACETTYVVAECMNDAIAGLAEAKTYGTIKSITRLGSYEVIIPTPPRIDTN